MPDVSGVTDASALFFAVISILFGVWYPELERIAKAERPDMYRNRKSYIVAIQSNILSKSIPLTVFLSCFTFSLVGIAIFIINHQNITISPSNISVPHTLFMLSFFVSVYLLALVILNLISLCGAWWRAGTDRGSGPRITLFR